METAIIVIVLFIGIPYLLGPIAVYFAMKLPREYRTKPVDAQKFLKFRNREFLALHDEILTIDFDFVGAAKLSQAGDDTPNSTDASFALYRCDTYKILAIVSSIAPPKQKNVHLPATTQLEFMRMYEDNTAIDVNNNIPVGVYPKKPYQRAFRYPKIRGAKELLNIALHVYDSIDLKDARIQFPALGKEFADVDEGLNRELAFLKEKGWIRENRTNTHHVPTVKGALFMTWKMCWPITQMRNALELRASQEILKRIDQYGRRDW